MACVDMDALAQYEVEAKQGRADALYNLGLAYSTGQGVTVDYIAAHKWFNLAAMKGSDLAKKLARYDFARDERRPNCGSPTPGTRVAEDRLLERSYMQALEKGCPPTRGHPNRKRRSYLNLK